MAAGGRTRATDSRDADVAQLVEHFTRNEGVRGSSPRVGFEEFLQSSLFLQRSDSARASRLATKGNLGRDSVGSAKIPAWHEPESQRFILGDREKVAGTVYGTII